MSVAELQASLEEKQAELAAVTADFEEVRLSLFRDTQDGKGLC